MGLKSIETEALCTNTERSMENIRLLFVEDDKQL